MNCDLCGKQAELATALVEGVELNVCSACAKYGTVIKRPQIQISKKEVVKSEEQIYDYVENYAEIIKRGREKLNLTQEEFAKKLSIRDTLIHKMESGRMKPSIDIAKKIEAFLKIKLTREIKEEFTAKKGKETALTIGDILKISKK